jgi:RimJ/RimL family protein N-acetyltransferase
VEVGYGIVAEHQRKGYATETALGLLRRAFGVPAVRRAVADTLPELAPSIGVLRKCGFHLVGEGSEPGVIRFELTREDYEDLPQVDLPHTVEIVRESIDSPAARALIQELNAEMLARYPEEGTAAHFRLDANEVAPGRGTFLVAYAGDTPLACGAVRLLEDGRAEIKRMFVAPEARGRGLGRRILEALESEASSLGARALVLETGPRQHEAIALYSLAGFSPIPAFGEYVESPLSLFMGKSF